MHLIRCPQYALKMHSRCTQYALKDGTQYALKDGTSLGPLASAVMSAALAACRLAGVGRSSLIRAVDAAPRRIASIREWTRLSVYGGSSSSDTGEKR